MVSMFNLTRPILAVNPYVSLERYQEHFLRLNNTYEALKNTQVSFHYKLVLLEEIAWTKKQIAEIIKGILDKELDEFQFGSPVGS